jgi:photosystem II stability/assembly factor-like uncharacterized protein
MPTPSLLISTWDNGLFSVTGKNVQHELPGQSVCSLAADHAGNVLAIVGGHALCRRSADGAWTTIAKSEQSLSCCVPVGNVVYVGTNDANILRMAPDGVMQRLAGFDTVEGRETWYAGTALVDGKLMGPPLGMRSIAATCDGAALLANVHVGGVPRSTDAGVTWQPTIAVESDVHQVCTHPSRPEIVIAAAAAGLCMSRDAGATWTITQHGLHAPYCSAVALGRNDLFVAASAGHFAEHGAIYRRPIESNGPLQPLGGGMPEWLNGIADTNCIAARESMVAVIDQAGNLYMSHDDGATWSRPCDRFAVPSGLHIC